MERFEILFSVLAALDKLGLLDRLVLIGSWCQEFYRLELGNPDAIPSARTTDADILIPPDIKVDPPVDVAAAMVANKFSIRTDFQSGLQKFQHSQLDVEFLTAAKAGPDESVRRFKRLGITAQELRFMNIPLEYHYQVQHRGLTINIPEPAAFAIQKLLVSTRRKKPEKAVKDRDAARGLLAYFEGHPTHMDRFRQIYATLPKGWQKSIRAALDAAGVRLTPPLPK